MGVLSKGITLACRGNNFNARYLHEFTLVAQDGNITFGVTNNSPDSLVGKYHNLAQVYGAYRVDNDGMSLVGSNVGGGTLFIYVAEIGVTAAETIEIGDPDFDSKFEIIEDNVSIVASTTEAFVELTNLQEIAELGNNAREKIDITVLSDDAKKSMDGLADTAQDLPFKFLYEKEQFNKLAAMEGEYEWRVTLPDGVTATFTASPAVKLAGTGVSAALTYTLTLSVTSEIVFA